MLKLIAIALAVFNFTQQLVEPPDIWATPVPYFEVQREFQAPITLHGPGHRGIDFQLEEDSEIQAPTDGIVHFAGKVVDDYYLTLRAATGLLVSFSGVCSALKQGERITARQVIGAPCSVDTESSTHCQSCSHLSVRSNHGYLNPELFFGLLEPSVLKS